MTGMAIQSVWIVPKPYLTLALIKILKPSVRPTVVNLQIRKPCLFAGRVTSLPEDGSLTVVAPASVWIRVML